MTTSPTPRRDELDLPLVVTHLCKGVVYADTHEKAWRHLLPLQTQVRDYVAVMGLTMVTAVAHAWFNAFFESQDLLTSRSLAEVETEESTGAESPASMGC